MAVGREAAGPTETESGEELVKPGNLVTPDHFFCVFYWTVQPAVLVNSRKQGEPQCLRSAMCYSANQVNHPPR